MERRIRLRDGRHIGTRESGAPGGRPLVWLGGTPASRLWRAPDEAATIAQGVRLIVVERPGFGVSDPQPGRRIVDWPRDLAEVTEALGLDRFALAGSSGAGPYLAACAWAMPERLSTVAMIACVGRLDDAPSLPRWRRATLAATRALPSLMTRALAWQARDPERFYRTITRDAAPCDRAILARPSVWQAQVAMTAEALRQGPRAFVDELLLASQPWGFRLEEIRARVVVWHGSEDHAAPIEMARAAARAIPGARAVFLDGAGHFLHFDRWGEVLRSLD